MSEEVMDTIWLITCRSHNKNSSFRQEMSERYFNFEKE